MTQDERRTKIDAIISDTLCVQGYEVVPTATLRDDLGADSMDMTMLAQDLEEEFSILFADSDGDSMRTVQDVYDVIERKVVQ